MGPSRIGSSGLAYSIFITEIHPKFPTGGTNQIAIFSQKIQVSLLESFKQQPAIRISESPFCRRRRSRAAREVIEGGIYCRAPNKMRAKATTKFLGKTTGTRTRRRDGGAACASPTPLAFSAFLVAGQVV